ncbi:hypothetical protein KUTeg_010507 [Tegillarca granosa]|uniref:G-protein coupled receptors family 1 profile domain-containing protein n=1 Tax=Tegillarca granosa TaxID=220873 RepID=A0ABQ9F8K6_TEGGR|nr:hypothetical protein KUTeg_010507 [Tegillarca granosa]
MEENSSMSEQMVEGLKKFHFSNITDDETEKLERLYSGFMIYLFSIYVIAIAPTILGNTLILASLVRFQRLRSRINILIGNLAVSDLLLGLVVIPFDIAFLHVKSLQEEKIPCLVRQSLNVILLDASILNLFCISLERYIAIVHPFKHAKLCKKRKLFILLSICWIVSIIVGAIPLMGWNAWEPGIFCDTELVWREKYRGIQYLAICSCLIVNFIMYVKVMRTACRRLKQSRKISGTSNNDSQRHISISKKDVRKTKIMVLILGIFAICWGPYCTVIIIETFFVDANITLIIVKKFFGCLGMLNSALNWIVYGIKNKNFRQAFKHILSFGVCTRKEGCDISNTK